MTQRHKRMSARWETRRSGWDFQWLNLSERLEYRLQFTAAVETWHGNSVVLIGWMPGLVL